MYIHCICVTKMYKPVCTTHISAHLIQFLGDLQFPWLGLLQWPSCHLQIFFQLLYHRALARHFLEDRCIPLERELRTSTPHIQCLVQPVNVQVLIIIYTLHMCLHIQQVKLHVYMLKTIVHLCAQPNLLHFARPVLGILLSNTSVFKLGLQFIQLVCQCLHARLSGRWGD